MSAIVSNKQYINFYNLLILLAHFIFTLKVDTYFHFFFGGGLSVSHFRLISLIKSDGSSALI